MRISGLEFRRVLFRSPAVRDPVADDPHRRRCGGAGRKRSRTQPQRAEQARRRELVQADEIYRYLVGHDSRRSEEHTSELQSLMRISYAVFCLKKKKQYEREKQLVHTKTI